MIRGFLIGLIIGLLGACGGDRTNARKKPDAQNPSSPKEHFQFNENANRCEKDGVAGFNEGMFMECGIIEGRSLTGEDYNSKSLRGIRLIDVDLSGANLSQTDLTGAYIERSNLSQADLSGVVFRMATLRDVNLRNSVLHGTQFVDLSDDEHSAELEQVILSGSVIDSATLMEGTLSDQIAQHGLKYRKKGQIGPQMEKVSGSPVSIEFNRSGQSALTDLELLRIKQDLLAFEDFELQGGNGWFEEIFGGSSMVDVLRYIDRGVDYVSSDTVVERDQSNKGVLAANLGVNFWRVIYNERNLGPYKPILTKNINGRSIAFDSPAVNFIEIGPQYVNLAMPQVRRMGTMVHETRHSYCPELPTNNLEIKAFIEGRTKTVESSICNFAHALCPKGHELEGRAACDNKPWGAYAVTAVFLEKIARDCVNCSEQDIQLALVSEKDTKTRVLILEQLLRGDHGKPDMRAVPGG